MNVIVEEKKEIRHLDFPLIPIVHERGEPAASYSWTT
jgi:hypothetical protein